MISGHTKKRPYKCKLCNKGFVDRYEFYQHDWEAHTENAFNERKKTREEFFRSMKEQSKSDSCDAKVEDKVSDGEGSGADCDMKVEDEVTDGEGSGDDCDVKVEDKMSDGEGSGDDSDVKVEDEVSDGEGSVDDSDAEKDKGGETKCDEDANGMGDGRDDILNEDIEHFEANHLEQEFDDVESDEVQVFDNESGDDDVENEERCDDLDDFDGGVDDHSDSVTDMTDPEIDHMPNNMTDPEIDQMPNNGFQNDTRSTSEAAQYEIDSPEVILNRCRKPIALSADSKALIRAMVKSAQNSITVKSTGTTEVHKGNYTCSHCGKTFLMFRSLDGHIKSNLCVKSGEPANDSVTHSAPKKASCSKQPQKRSKSVCNKIKKSPNIKNKKGNDEIWEDEDHVSSKYKDKFSAVGILNSASGITTFENQIQKTLYDFRCRTCLKVYKTKTQLQRHILVHVNDKTYKCSICDSRFGLESEMLQHYFKAHVSNN